MKTFFDRVRYLQAALRVKRCHTQIVHHEQTIGEHSAGVALFCYLLTDRRPSWQLLMAALTHDLGEQEYGDLPGQVKRRLLPDVGRALERAEEEFVRGELGMSFALTDQERVVLSLADKFDLMMYCCTERASGNEHVRTMWLRTLEMTPPRASMMGSAQEIYEVLTTLWRQHDEQGH